MGRSLFTGASDDEVSSGNTGLYAFRWEPDWVPESLRATPVVRTVFENAGVIQWEEDDDALAAADANPEVAATAGEVRVFDWDGERTFYLSTFALGLTFTADAAEVTFHHDSVA